MIKNMIKNNIKALLIHFVISLIVSAFSQVITIILQNQSLDMSYQTILRINTIANAIILIVVILIYLFMGFWSINRGINRKYIILSVVSIFVFSLAIWLWVAISIGLFGRFPFYRWYLFYFSVGSLAFPLMGIFGVYWDGGIVDPYRFFNISVCLTFVPSILLYIGTKLRDPQQPEKPVLNIKLINKALPVIIIITLVLTSVFFKIPNNDNSVCAVQDGEWIYYKDDNDRFLWFRLSRLYKIKEDGSQRTKISNDNPFTMAVEDDWIYYSNEKDGRKLYKIKTDGSGREKLNSVAVAQIKVNQEYIYFLSGEQLYRVKTDGTELELIHPAPINMFDIYDNQIFIASFNGIRNISKVDHLVALKLSYIVSFEIENEWLYYMLNAKSPTYRINLKDGRKEEALWNTFLDVKNNWIYYIEDYKEDSPLYKKHLETKETIFLTMLPKNARNVIIAGKWLFYNDNLGHFGKINRIQLEEESTKSKGK